MEGRGHNNFLIILFILTMNLLNILKGRGMTCPPDILDIDHIFQFNRILFPTSSHLCVQVRPQESEVVHLLAVKCEMGVMELYFEAHSHCPGISVDRRWHPWELHCHSAGKVETFKWRIVFVELIFDTGQGGVWSLGQARLLRARG